MARLYGRCARGQRLVAKAPFANGGPSPSCQLCAEGLTRPAPSTDRSTPRGSTPVSSILVPILKPGDIVASTTSAPQEPAIRAAILAAKSKLFIPACLLPDIHPIELAISKMKAPLRNWPSSNNRRTHRTIGSPARLLQAKRMRELLQTCRLRFKT